MPLDNEPSHLEALLAEFKEDLEAADVFTEYGAQTPLQNLPTFDHLEGNEDEIMRAVSEHYGIDLSSPEVISEHSMQGTEGSPGEGQIKVEVIKTNKPGIYLGKHTYQDAKVVWTIRPLEVEE